MDSKIIVFAVVGLLVGVGAGVGTGYMMWNSDATDGEEYNFYLHFGADDERNGWYGAQGSNANDGFSKAMDKAGFEWEANEYGYIGKIDNVGKSGWYLCQYLYEKTDEAAANGSVVYPIEEYGTLTFSNGWKSISGYGSDNGMKLGQFNGNVYFFSPYNDDFSAESPVSVNAWMNSGPFAA